MALASAGRPERAGAAAPKITVGPVWARLQASRDATAAAWNALSVEDPSAERTWTFKNGRWDGMVRFMRPDGEFPSGLTWRVASALIVAGHGRPEIEWPPVQDAPPLAPPMVGMEWRAYQVEAVEKALRARRMALQCPTRGGKTEIALEFIRRVGAKALWVTHTRELLRQTPERILARLGIEAGVVAGPVRTDGRIVVAMVQTLHGILQSDKEFFRQFGTLVMDEGHHAGADTWQAVAGACENAQWRLALSGTMATSSPVADMKIESAFGPTWVAATTMELAALGFVARPRVVLLRPPPSSYPSYEEVREAVCPGWRDDPMQLTKLGGPLFREAYRRGIIENAPRNQMVMETVASHVAYGEKVLVLCNRVPHAAFLTVAMDRRMPCRVFGLDGSAPDEQRESVLFQFKGARGAAVLVCTPFFREGTDVPQIDVGVLAAGGASDVAVLQALGRMLTVRPDKTEVLIYDFADGRDPRKKKDYLAQHFWESRLPLYREQGFTVEGA